LVGAAPPRRLQKTLRILSAGAKGGPGKTFLVKNLSAAAADEGFNVGVVDFDEQRSLTKWLARRAKKSPERVGITGYEANSSVIGDAEEAITGEDHDIVFFDTPPAVTTGSPVLKTLAFGADLILVPSLVGITDTESAETLLCALAEWKRPSLAVVNKVKPKANRVIGLAKKRLLRHAELAPIEIGEYYDFLAADEVGLGATEIERCVGGDDIEAIWSVVKRRLGLGG
jgi:cellulose biosynthesis protein BcsQ